MSITIRPYQQADEAAVENITYRTGFKGEGLEERDYFNVKRLFFMIFIAYYARYEPDHFFVAEDDVKREVVGYICGTTYTIRQEKRFALTMIWRIFLRAIFVTSWQSPKTIKTLFGLGRVLPEMRKQPENPIDINGDYPAHLHINVLPEYHHTGIGSQLIQHFEDHLRCLGIKGIHLETSNSNHKAVPFYHKHGYTIVKEVHINSHPVFDEISFYTFAKKLIHANN